jgi:hypothetical protein
MADQNRNRSNQGNQHSQQGGRRPDDDQSSGMGQSRGRSNREPASSADDRGIGDARGNLPDDDRDEVDSDVGVESDLDHNVRDIDDTDEGDG